MEAPTYFLNGMHNRDVQAIKQRLPEANRELFLAATVPYIDVIVYFRSCVLIVIPCREDQLLQLKAELLDKEAVNTSTKEKVGHSVKRFNPSLYSECHIQPPWELWGGS